VAKVLAFVQRHLWHIACARAVTVAQIGGTNSLDVF